MLRTDEREFLDKTVFAFKPAIKSHGEVFEIFSKTSCYQKQLLLIT